MWHAAGCPSGRKLAQEIHNLASCTKTKLAEAVAEKLRGMSVSTIDRILRQEKAKITKSTIIQSSQQSSAEDNERLASDGHAQDQKRRSGTGKPGRKTIIDELWHEIEELRRNQPKLSAGKILKILMTRNPGKLRETQLSTIKTRLNNVHRHAAKTTPRIGSAKFYLEPDWKEIHWSQHLTHTGALVGSVHYMSPEQCSGKRADARCDIYSLGCILYELLVGAPPLAADDPIGTMRKHVEETPRSLSHILDREHLPPGLDAVVLKALAKSTEDRYQSMNELSCDLSLVAEGRGDEISHARPNRLSLSKSSRITIVVLAFIVASSAAVVLNVNRITPLDRGPGQGTHRALDFVQQIDSVVSLVDSDQPSNLANSIQKITIHKDSMQPTSQRSAVDTKLSLLLTRVSSRLALCLSSNNGSTAVVELAKARIRLAQCMPAPKDERIAAGNADLAIALMRVGRQDEAEKYARAAVDSLVQLTDSTSKDAMATVVALSIFDSISGRAALAPNCFLHLHPFEFSRFFSQYLQETAEPAKVVQAVNTAVMALPEQTRKWDLANALLGAEDTEKLWQFALPVARQRYDHIQNEHYAAELAARLILLGKVDEGRRYLEEATRLFWKSNEKESLGHTVAGTELCRAHHALGEDELIKPLLKAFLPESQLTCDVPNVKYSNAFSIVAEDSLRTRNFQRAALAYRALVLVRRQLAGNDAGAESMDSYIASLTKAGASATQMKPLFELQNRLARKQ